MKSKRYHCTETHSLYLEYTMSFSSDHLEMWADSWEIIFIHISALSIIYELLIKSASCGFWLSFFPFLYSFHYLHSCQRWSFRVQTGLKDWWCATTEILIQPSSITRILLSEDPLNITLFKLKHNPKCQCSTHCNKYVTFFPLVHLQLVCRPSSRI